jgi:hypothetical protein
VKFRVVILCGCCVVNPSEFRWFYYTTCECRWIYYTTCEFRWIYYRINLLHGFFIWLFKANSLTVGVARPSEGCIYQFLKRFLTIKVYICCNVLKGSIYIPILSPEMEHFDFLDPNRDSYADGTEGRDSPNMYRGADYSTPSQPMSFENEHARQVSAFQPRPYPTAPPPNYYDNWRPYGGEQQYQHLHEHQVVPEHSPRIPNPSYAEFEGVDKCIQCLDPDCVVQLPCGCALCIKCYKEFMETNDIKHLQCLNCGSPIDWLQIDVVPSRYISKDPYPDSFHEPYEQTLG